MLNKNEDNLDNSLRLMAPFYRVFANTLGNGPWFDTYIQNLPARSRRWADMDLVKKLVVPAGHRRSLLVAAARSPCSAATTTKTLTAHFPRTVSLYEGSDVRVLGVPVGKVDKVDAAGTDVVGDDALRRRASRSPPTPRP